MVRFFATTAGRDAAMWPHRRHSPRPERRGAFGTGSFVDTSPRNGCCIATLVAIWELAANTAASGSSLTVVAVQELVVPVWELTDFAGNHAVTAYLSSIQN
jgi:hypothetical protein